MIHKNVIDTSVVFFDGSYKRGLAVLSAEILGRIIQSDGQCSIVFLCFGKAYFS